MKELIYSHKDKKGFWKKATALAGGIALLTACDQKPQITDGTVYQKEYTKQDWAFVAGKYWSTRYEIDREAVSMQPIHEERGFFDKETILTFPLCCFGHISCWFPRSSP